MPSRTHARITGQNLHSIVSFKHDISRFTTSLFLVIHPSLFHILNIAFHIPMTTHIPYNHLQTKSPPALLHLTMCIITTYSYTCGCYKEHRDFCVVQRNCPMVVDRDVNLGYVCRECR